MTSYKRIAITGPECSGKTTLAETLHEHLGGTLVLEFARRYLDKTGGRYEQEDLDAIALGQMRQWMATHQHPIISDTEMSTLKIWSLEKYGSCSDLIQTFYDKQQFDLYILCRPDIAWVADPLRENPNDRDLLFKKYLTELESSDREFIIWEGERNIDLLLSKLKGE